MRIRAIVTIYNNIFANKNTVFTLVLRRVPCGLARAQNRLFLTRNRRYQLTQNDNANTH